MRFAKFNHRFDVFNWTDFYGFFKNYYMYMISKVKDMQLMVGSSYEISYEIMINTFVIRNLIRNITDIVVFYF